MLGRPREHIGIRATRDIRPGEVLLRVPRELTLDVHLLIKHSATHLARRPALANFFPSREGAVLLSGIIESAYSDFWQPWRATLPATYLENPGLWWSMPGTFARTIRAVEAPITGYHALNISYEATGLGQYIREEHARFVQAYSDDPDPKHRAAVCGPRSFSWAMLTAATRGLRHLRDPSGQGLALVPILDLFNHDATENVAWNLTGVGDRVDADGTVHADGAWVAVAKAPAAAGEQLFIDYGHPKIEAAERHFTASYGFSHLTADRHHPPAADDLLSSMLAAARELAEEEWSDAYRALRWPRTWPPSPYEGWLWCESCPAALEEDAGFPPGGFEPASDSRGWAVSVECQRQAKDFGASRAGKCVTLGADCPPPRRRRAPTAGRRDAASTGGPKQELR